jgi:hypothetical protein
VLAVATDEAVVEYDAPSGCRRFHLESSGSPAQLQYSPDGNHLILLTKVRFVLYTINYTARQVAPLSHLFSYGVYKETYKCVCYFDIAIA